MEYVSTPIVDGVVNVLGGTCHIVISAENNIRCLEKEIGELKSLKEDLFRRIEEAKKQRLRTTHHVEWWIREVEALECDQKRIREDYKKRHYLNIRSRFKLSKEASSKSIDAQKLIDQGRMFEEVAVADEIITGHIIRMPSKLGVGIDGMFSKIWDSVQQGEEGIIGIHGMGGVGKTTLMHKLNNDVCESGDFDVVMLIEASENCNEEVIQQGIFRELRMVWVQDEDRRIRASRIYEILETKRFLIMLDDVWEELDLQLIGIPRPRGGERMSKIVIASRLEEVCNQMEVQKRIDVKCLPWLESWELFLEKAGNEFVCSHPEIFEHAQVIASKCGGLPLALQTLGLAMASKRTSEEWEQAVRNLDHDPSAIPGVEKKIFSRLKRSYDNIKEEELKKCFLHCSLFPEGCSFDRRVLPADWICHGLVDTSDGKVAALGRGQDTIIKLKSACLLEGVDDCGDEVKMHGMMRSLALWIASECGQKKYDCLVQTGSQLTEAPDEDRWRDARTISLFFNNITVLPEAPVCRDLTCLLLAANKSLNKIPNDFFRWMPSLNVLDLSWTSIEKLPADIRLLATLTHLDLNHTQLRSLPKELGSLEKLKYLDLSSIPTLEVIPKGLISRLSLTLQVLRIYKSYGRWNLGAYMGGVSFQELEGLNRLKILDLTIETGLALQRLSESSKLATSMDNLNLRHLSAGTKTIELPNSFGEKMKSMRRLAITKSNELEDVVIGCGDKNWSLDCLKLVALAKARIIYKQLQHGHFCLRKLRVLEITSCTQVEQVIDYENDEDISVKIVFENLQTLRLQDLPQLKLVCEDWSSFPSLRTLEIIMCSKLKKLPYGIEKNTNLKCIKGNREWWDGLKWVDETVGLSLEHLVKVSD